jgi:aldehyde dehydrogenase
VIYREDTIFNQRYSKGITKCVFSRRNFGPVLAVTTFKTTEEAIAIANDTMYGLGAGLWTRDAHEIYQVPRAIQAGRVWVNQYHAYPAGAPFGYKQSALDEKITK